MPFLVQLLLPLRDDQGHDFPAAMYTAVTEELTDRFGGATAYRRAPAEGAWRHDGETERDRIVVFEAMADRLDRAWWAAYRHDLERRFRQEKIVVRAMKMERM